MLNKVILMGRLVTDPELKATRNGTTVVSIRIAVERSYAVKGQERGVDFISCIAWRQTAEFISQYFRKGNLILAEGSIQTRSYEDKSGMKRTATEIIIEQAYFTGKSSGAGQAQNTQNTQSTPALTPSPQAGAQIVGNAAVLGIPVTPWEEEAGNGELPF